MLDEPTNDLDLETLDLLQEVIADYEGTVLIVSHDRDFLDRTVTITLGLDGSRAGSMWWPAAMRIGPSGKILPGTGRGTALRSGVVEGACEVAAPPPSAPSALPPPRRAEDRRKLTYKDQRDLDRLPGEIERIEREIAAAEAALHDPDLYGRSPERFASLTAELARLRVRKGCGRGTLAGSRGHGGRARRINLGEPQNRSCLTKLVDSPTRCMLFSGHASLLRVGE